MTEQELDEILTLRWPSMVRRVMADVNADDFTKGFARSVSRHGKRAGWLPSDKQQWVMRQMLADYGPTHSSATEPDVIERQA